MMLRHVRTLVAGLAAAVALAGFAGSAPAQGPLDPKLPGRPEFDYRDERQLRAMKDGKTRVSGPDAEKNKAVFKAAAERFVYGVNEPDFYGLDSGDGQLKPRLPNQTLDAIFRDLERYLLVPEADSKLTTDQAEYVAGFGAALDVAVQTMLASRNPLVRVNAARVLTVAAASGAPAHARSITALLTDPNTPPEILFHVYKAAGSLLSAYDPLAVRNTDPNRHSVPDELLVPLVQALEQHVLTNPPVARHVAVEAVGPPPEGGAAPAEPVEPAPGDGKLDPAGMTSDQIAIVRFFRREAVRALAKVRYDVLGGEKDVPETRPAYTLARVAVGDPAIAPSPGPIETAEAVIGLLTILPGNKLNVDVLAQAVATGLANFARAKGLPGSDPGPTARLVSWKMYSARLGQAFDAWQASVRTNPRALAYQDVIRSLSSTAMTDIVSRLDRDNGGVGAGLNVNRLTDWQARNPPKDPNRSLFNDSPKYKLDVGRPGA